MLEDEQACSSLAYYLLSSVVMLCPCLFLLAPWSAGGGRQEECGPELCVRQLRVCGSQLAVCLVSLFVSVCRSCVSSSSVLRPPIPRWCPVRAWLFFTLLHTYMHVCLFAGEYRPRLPFSQGGNSFSLRMLEPPARACAVNSRRGLYSPGLFARVTRECRRLRTSVRSLRVHTTALNK